MLNRSHLASVALVAAGAVLGWATASGRLTYAKLAAGHAETPAKATTTTRTPARPCCDAAGTEAARFPVAAYGPEVAANLQKEGKKPNVLVIWGDDIGTWNISHNNRGMMGYKTPNIDRIAKEGVSFTS